MYSFSATTKIFRSDFGGEYLSLILYLFIFSGILLQLSHHGAHAQNRVAECKHHLEAARSPLSSHTSPRFYTNVVIVAYLISIQPSSFLRYHSAGECLFGSLIAIITFMFFGVVTFVRLDYICV